MGLERAVAEIPGVALSAARLILDWDVAQLPKPRCNLHYVLVSATTTGGATIIVVLLRAKGKRSLRLALPKLGLGPGRGDRSRNRKRIPRPCL